MIDREIYNKIYKKSLKCICTYRVVAVAFDKRGDILTIATNRPRFKKLGGSVHAEMEAIRLAGPKIVSMQIFRLNKLGGLLPIHPCKSCQRILDKMNIKVK